MVTWEGMSEKDTVLAAIFVCWLASTSPFGLFAHSPFVLTGEHFLLIGNEPRAQSGRRFPHAQLLLVHPLTVRNSMYVVGWVAVIGILPTIVSL